jgi:hypothetical protein
MFAPFKGENKYFVGLSISIANYTTCKSDEKQKAFTRFHDLSGTLRLKSAGHIKSRM